MNPARRDDHEEIARIIYPHWRDGLSTPEIINRVGNLGHDQSTVQRIINKYMPVLAAEEVLQQGTWNAPYVPKPGDPPEGTEQDGMVVKDGCWQEMGTRRKK